jgi:hypothetical protein
MAVPFPGLSYHCSTNFGVRVNQRLVFPLTSTDFPRGFPLPLEPAGGVGWGCQAAEMESTLTLAESRAVDYPDPKFCDLCFMLA